MTDLEEKVRQEVEKVVDRETGLTFGKMKIKVKFFTSLREITGKKEDEIQSPNIITVEELLTHLSKKYGREFTEYLYDEKGNVQTYIQILINGRGINALQGFETKLKGGDTVAIFPPVGGG